jgi:hypothetical protein
LDYLVPRGTCHGERAAMKNQERIVAAIRKGPRNVVRVTLSMRGHHQVIDIRQFEPNGLRVLVPTMKGVNIDLAVLPILIAALETIKEGERS